MSRPVSPRKSRAAKPASRRTAKSSAPHIAKLRETQKLAVLGTLSASIVHEIRNPLATLTLSLETIARELPEESKLQTALAHSQTSVERIQKIIHTTLGYVKSHPVQHHDVDAPSLIADSLALVNTHIPGKTIEFHVAIERHPFPALKGNRGQLLQALVNILTNAVESIEHAGNIHIVARTKTKKHDGSVILEVSDTGVGMSNAAQKKIFNAFYSGKESGTGLGLAITRQILDRHDAVIGVVSSPGKGTTFAITFPPSPKRSR